MAIETLYDKDGSLAPLQGKTVAVLGYGSQGHAHSQNLRDSGVNVIVANRKESANGKKAIEDGFEPLPVADAVKQADLVIIAPATANILAKAATGICDDLVSTVLCAVPQTTPVLFAPAMNADMWANPVTQRNISTVKDLLNWKSVGPEEGWQACRTLGAGRMSEPDAIFDAASDCLTA